MDNAPSMDVLARILGILLSERYGLSFHSDNARIRCLAHIINIVVQTILKYLDEADDPNLVDYYETMKNLPVHYNPDEDEELKEMEQEKYDETESSEVGEDEVSAEELPEDAEALSPVKKVRSIYYPVLFYTYHSCSFGQLSTKLFPLLNVVNISTLR